MCTHCVRLPQTLSKPRAASVVPPCRRSPWVHCLPACRHCGSAADCSHHSPTAQTVHSSAKPATINITLQTTGSQHTAVGCYVTAPLLTNRCDAYTWCRPENMKCITYCTVVRVGPSHVKSGRGFWSTITSNHSPYATAPLSCLSVTLGVLWPNDWMNQDATWYEGRPRPRPHCVRWGSSSPSHGNRHISPPHFSAHVYWSQTFAHLSNCWVLFEICEQQTKTDIQTHLSQYSTIWNVFHPKLQPKGLPHFKCR